MAKLAYEMGEGLSGEAARGDALSIAHAKLFLGPFEVLAAPWASVYLDPEQRLMGPFSRYAAEADAEAGLGPGDGPSDAPDHVTRELEFMYFLTFQEPTTGGPTWLERQQRFWHEHLGLWLPKLADVVKEAAGDSGRKHNPTVLYCDPPPLLNGSARNVSLRHITCGWDGKRSYQYRLVAAP